MTDKLTVMGRVLGEYNGWEEFDPMVHAFYNFTPLPGIALPSGTLTIDYDAGTVLQFDAEGNETESLDLVPILSVLPRSTPE